MRFGSSSIAAAFTAYKTKLQDMKCSEFAWDCGKKKC